MAFNLKINFDDCYETEILKADFSLSSFNTCLKNGKKERIGIHISDTVHPLIPDVHNLSFGPINNKGEIDDNVKLNHLNHSKFFSTIVLAAMTFLERKRSCFLGIDGSNNARAYMYYRCIQNNYSFLTQYFKIFGVNYYARILRKEKDEDSSYPIDVDDIFTLPKSIQKEVIITYEKLYNYFIFKLI
ncbi:DUF6934 family protein [Chitinophaga sp. RAB17]|uniref:DUF6934 family protein n=1 Tax=Chitinophaga sp. RAB17 TaxID=3233049 RepID=UPI003F907CEB